MTSLSEKGIMTKMPEHNQLSHYYFQRLASLLKRLNLQVLAIIQRKFSNLFLSNP